MAVRLRSIVLLSILLSLVVSVLSNALSQQEEILTLALRSRSENIIFGKASHQLLASVAQHLVTPSSCRTSVADGKQRLASGELAVCEDGWRVVQKRFDGSVSFERGWKEYVRGFGNFDGEFWIGLDKLHEITGVKVCRLRVEMRKFDDSPAYAEYGVFSVDGPDKLYKLYVGDYRGTAGNSMSMHNNMYFTTYDRDHDKRASQNCAVNAYGRHGGWWYNSCYGTALNSPWGSSPGKHTNIQWYSGGFTNEYEDLKYVVMKIRCGG